MSDETKKCCGGGCCQSEVGPAVDDSELEAAAEKFLNDHGQLFDDLASGFNEADAREQYKKLIGDDARAFRQMASLYASWTAERDALRAEVEAQKNAIHSLNYLNSEHIEMAVLLRDENARLREALFAVRERMVDIVDWGGKVECEASNVYSDIDNVLNDGYALKAAGEGEA
jgi:uncharacterized protein YfcZ (UPF0381/DUF406 family)